MRRNRAKNFLQEFKDFALKGNIVDISIAVIISAAFGKIIESFISDIVTPLLLKPAMDAARVRDLASLSLGGILYGKFLAATLNFIVIALVIFLMVRVIAATKREEAIEEIASEPTAQEIAQERLIASLDRVSEALEEKAL